MTLDAWMKAQGLLDRTVAEAVGVERSRITKLRHGVASPSLRLALRLAEYSGGAVTPTDYPPPVQEVA